MKKITPKQAEKINEKLGLETWEADGEKTFWASDDKEEAIWCFDTLKERNDFVENCNKAK